MRVNSFYQHINEGVYDPGIFKAFFLAGGPGSGKSFVTSRVFAGTGLKLVNSDNAFERQLKKTGLSLQMPDSEAYFRDIIRKRAKTTVLSGLDQYMRGRLGLVIDSTARDYDTIARQMSQLKQLGYDCYMVFVNTDLEVALKRNAKRDRKVPEDIVKKAWQEVNQNLGKYQSLFGGSNMLIVDNSEYKEFEDKVKSKAMQFVNRPIQNHIAKKWIKKELEVRKWLGALK